jgi:hypothetical protein
MQTVLRELFQMFYPMSAAEQRRWAAILSSPDAEYASALEGEARKRGLGQGPVRGGVAWSDGEGRQLMLLFRLRDPSDLAAVRGVYEAISENEAPLAYAFVHQTPDGEGTWDIFHMSKLTYLAHCNRVSGPGADCEG